MAASPGRGKGSPSLHATSASPVHPARPLPDPRRPPRSSHPAPAHTPHPLTVMLCARQTEQPSGAEVAGVWREPPSRAHPPHPASLCRVGTRGLGSRPPTACVPTAHGSPHTPQHAGHRLLTLRTRRGSLSGKFLAQLGSGSKASHVPRGVPGTGTSLGTGGVRGLSHRRDAADGNLSNSRCSWPVYHAVWPNCVPQIHRRKSRPRSSERGWMCRRLFTEGREVR